MPYHDEEYPGQPLWQSVLLFCCKGMIEGIMVLLFFWLLVQVLFTKQLEGEAQTAQQDELQSLCFLCFCPEPCQFQLSPNAVNLQALPLAKQTVGV